MASPRLLHALPAVYAAAAVRLLQPLLVLPLMAQRLGPEAFGRVSFVLVWSALLAMLVEGGFLAAATRLAVNADAPQRWRLAQQVASARSLLCLPTLLLAGLVVALLGAPGSGLAETLTIAALACALGWPATWYLQASQQLAGWARTELVVYAALIAATVWLAHDAATFLALQLAASTALALLGWRWLQRDLAPAAEGSGLLQRDALAPGLRLGWTMLPVSVAGAAYSAALPAAASVQMGPQALGTYFLGDRLLRAVLNAAEPVFALVYPRIVARQAQGLRASLVYAGRWAVGGGLAGLALLGGLTLAWQMLEPLVAQRAGQVDLPALREVLARLGWLLPLLLGWKFIGYWMLGSGRFDGAYRTCVVVGGVAGTLGAATWATAATPPGLALLAVGVELLVIAVAVAGMALTRR
ncbi:oligosaccharide flippase family protein [Ideonella alba]|uniref:Oligosaccharide flippase family protein n=1 Tax=Ideonella alba TaxID=2824118 RepID=A0A940Y7E9_9BURK|nr:oligosaccharide flippase family protein [Ideonella alba]MBQ0929620.1 oligosaccharide flippase family protein [Ideonella alba]